MSEDRSITPLGLLRLQTWLSPAFPIGAYSYSHGIEWAVETGEVHDCESLVDWLEADLCHGSGRNEAIFFAEAWRCAANDHRDGLLRASELAAAYRGTAEFALESCQQAHACMTTLSRVWPNELLRWLAIRLQELDIPPVPSIVLGSRTGSERIPLGLALPAFLQSYFAGLVTAGVRLIPLGQTAGQLAVARLEESVIAVGTQALESTLDAVGSASLKVDLASMAHETQYTRLFRS
jgi:urease accessory protein